MIRSTLFKSLAPALRDSLSDAEVCVLGMWLLASTGVYPTRGVSIYAKDERGTAAIEEAARGRYTYPEGTAPDVALAMGSINATYRLPTAGNPAYATAISGIEDLMYTVVRSNEEHEQEVTLGAGVPAPPQAQPDGTLARNAVTQAGWQNLDRTAPEQPWLRRLNENPPAEIAEPPRMQVFEQRAVERPTELERMDEMMLERLRELRAQEARRVEALARTTRGIPNRR